MMYIMDHKVKKDLYTLPETCAWLQISMPTAKRWIYSEKLLAHLIGRKWMVPYEEIQKFLAYKVSRIRPMEYANAPLQDDEAGMIADVLAAALRQVGAPERADKLKRMIVGTIQPHPSFWRFLHRVLTSGKPEEGELSPPKRIRPHTS
jgi:excisionase family DNA binding protein